MSRLILNKGVAPSIPAGGKISLFASNDTPAIIRSIDESGNNNNISELVNYNVTAQSIPAAARTYIAGSMIIIPISKIKIGTRFKWTFTMTKTAAGVAASTIDIAIGTNGTTGDTARVSFAKPAGTAVADEAVCEIEAIVRGPLSASCIMAGNFWMAHNLAATGHAIIPNVVVTTISSAFNITSDGLKVGLCITTGASDAITIQMVTAECLGC